MIWLWWACHAVVEPPTIAARLGDARYLTPIDVPLTIDGAQGPIPTSADACGACHPDHHAEWAGSTHARATRDLQYTAELSKPGQPRWLCLNCHAPTSPQRAQRFDGSTRFVTADAITRIQASPNPAFAPERVDEGVTCATCHVRRDPGGAGVVIGPRGAGRAPHPVRVDPGALRDVCVGCHSPGPAQISPTFVCWFETADELARSATPDAACVDCHMPPAERPAGVGGPPVALRRHLWQGGGVPKDADAYAPLVAAAWTPGFDVAFADGVVTLTNARAAHAIPTGDPERHLRVEARVEGPDGVVLGRDALRIGQTWDWGDEASGRVAHRTSDNRLGPGEARRWTPRLPAGGARVVVTVAHVRVTPENAAYMAQAKLDDELRALHPGADPAAAATTYPLGTIVFEGDWPTDGGPPTITPTAALLDRSRALVAAPLADDAAVFGLP